MRLHRLMQIDTTFKHDLTNTLGACTKIGRQWSANESSNRILDILQKKILHPPTLPSTSPDMSTPFGFGLGYGGALLWSHRLLTFITCQTTAWLRYKRLMRYKRYKTQWAETQQGLQEEYWTILNQKNGLQYNKGWWNRFWKEHNKEETTNTLAPTFTI